MSRACPCGRIVDGRAVDLDACCEPVIDGEREAETCDELMRSRYTAFALGRTDHLARSWHPRTRPDDLTSTGVRWTRLRVLGSEGGPGDDHGWVEFEARYSTGDGVGTLHESSRFVRRAGRWVYVDGATRVDGEADGDAGGTDGVRTG